MAYEDQGWDPGAPGVSYDNFSFSCGSVTYGGQGNNYFTYYASTIYSSISYVEFYYYQDGSYHLDYDGSGNTKFYLDKSSYPYTASMTTYGWRTLSYSYSVSIQCKFYRSDGTVYTTLTSSVTFPATTVNYTISYNKNGATSGSAPDSQTVSSGSTATLRTNTGNMAKTGYYTDGWATSTTGSKAYDFGGRYTVSSNATFYAHWVPRTYTVTANPNSGTLSATSGWSISNNIGTKTVTYDSTYGTLCSASRTGYSLKG